MGQVIPEVCVLLGALADRSAWLSPELGPFVTRVVILLCELLFGMQPLEPEKELKEKS